MTKTLVCDAILNASLNSTRLNPDVEETKLNLFSKGEPTSKLSSAYLFDYCEDSQEVAIKRAIEKYMIIDDFKVSEFDCDEHPGDIHHVSETLIVLKNAKNKDSHRITSLINNIELNCDAVLFVFPSEELDSNVKMKLTPIKGCRI